MEVQDRSLQELTETLEAGVKEVFSGGKYQEYLNAMSKFHTYSANNIMLIYRQKSDASHVAGFGAWQAMGRSVNKGEHGLQILSPMPYKTTQTVTRDDAGNLLPKPQRREITVTAFRRTYVFDISQTNGKELPKLIKQLTGQVTEYSRLLQGLVKASPCPVSFEAIEGSVNGYYEPENNRIAISEGMSEEQTVKTLVHEIAHARLGHGDNPNIDRSTGEVQAESVAYVVCQHFGIDSSQYSFGYVAGWGKDKDMTALKGCLGEIRDISCSIINTTELELTRELTHEITADRPQQTEQIGKSIEKESVHQEALEVKPERTAPKKPKKLGVAERLEMAKKEVAERAASAPQQQPQHKQDMSQER